MSGSDWSEAGAGLTERRRLRYFVARALWTSALVALLLAGPACSADAVDESPPTLETAGVFVARQDAVEGGYRLFRVLSSLRVQPTEIALFVSAYAVRTDTIDDARRAAKRPNLPLLVPVEILSDQQFTSVPYEIVWFRSLNEEERARVQ